MLLSTVWDWLASLWELSCEWVLTAVWRLISVLQAQGLRMG